MRAAMFLLLPIVVLVGCEQPQPGTPGPTPAASYRSLVLETVMTSRRVRAQNPDGTFASLFNHPIPTPYAEVRFQADQFLGYTVTANGIVIPSGEKPNDHKWFSLRDTPLRSGMRKRFQVIHVDFPVDMELAQRVTLNITATVLSGVAPSLMVVLVTETVAGAALRPTDVFVQGTNNTKPSMTDSVIASDVVVAGWLNGELFDRGDAGAQPNESEDIHYSIAPDNDFLVRNYLVGNIVLEPLASALMKGNASYYHPESSPQFPLIQDGIVNAGALTIPGLDWLRVELNAWHIAARGPIPDGWQSDADQSLNDAYPWNSFAPWAGHKLKQGDYVIISGNLWQDTAHLKSCADSTCPMKKCWEDAIQHGYGGWLEVHPPNSVRFVDGPGAAQAGDPPTRTETFQRSLCDPVASSYNSFIAPTIAAPDATSVLRFETQVDRRRSADGRYQFSDPTAVHSEVVEPNCQGQLHIRASVGPGKTFKAVYLLWWEPGTTPRKDQCPKAPQPKPAWGSGD